MNFYTRTPVIGLLNTLALGAMAQVAVKLDRRQNSTVTNILQSVSGMPMDLINIVGGLAGGLNQRPISASMGYLTDVLPLFYAINVTVDGIIKLTRHQYDYKVNAPIMSALNGGFSYLFLDNSGGNFTMKQKILTSLGMTALTFGTHALLHADEFDEEPDFTDEYDVYRIVFPFFIGLGVHAISVDDPGIFSDVRTALRKGMIAHIASYTALSLYRYS